MSCDFKLEKGYVALASVLVISAVITVILISVSLLSISESQISLADKRSEVVIDAIEGCVEEALWQLNENNYLPVSIVLPQIVCSVVINSQIGNDWDFTVSGMIEGYDKSVRVVVNRGTALVISSWQVN